MGLYHYTPVWAGAICDPLPAGGEVTRLDLYPTPARDGVPLAGAGPSVRVRPEVYRFDVPDTVPPGRYWTVATFTPAQGVPAVVDRSRHVDLPLDTGLAASPEAVADLLGTPLPLTPAQRERYAESIADAQADVAGYLGRPLVPRRLVLTDVTPAWGMPLDDPSAWPTGHLDDFVTVLTYAAQPDGRYRVDVLVGLDAAQEAPIRRYVAAHAAESLRNRPADGEDSTGRRVSSVSAEGQSISYEAAPATGQAGALPGLESLSGFRKLTYRPITSSPTAPWPYSSGRYGRR
ncbi:hypothetical protein G3I60_05320 [Streptomyces sp. SID13666]|uniref:hypothetical protein n=1 Tax=Streptomyces sp. SID13666 TaxID=2706054 RepID=UPI0013C1FAD9|nr:hypothetical protein [Streptomyces sp. SID13666]NEA53591.1 hypothetical protein [Streptomyces sp. SID13666]